MAPNSFLSFVLLFNVSHHFITFLFLRLYGREDSTNSECCSKTTTLPHHPNVSTSVYVVYGVLLWNRGKLIKVLLSKIMHNCYWGETFFFLLYYYMQVMLASLKLSCFSLPSPRQVWATNIPPKCLPIWHCVSVNSGGGQRLEACHHHQTGLITLFFITSLLSTLLSPLSMTRLFFFWICSTYSMAQLTKHIVLLCECRKTSCSYWWIYW